MIFTIIKTKCDLLSTVTGKTEMVDFALVFY
jgi:hypothetical protein